MIGVQCLTCGGWYMFEASALRCRERHIPQMMVEGAAKRAAYEASRRRYRELHPHQVVRTPK